MKLYHWQYIKWFNALVLQQFKYFALLIFIVLTTEHVHTFSSTSISKSSTDAWDASIDAYYIYDIWYHTILISYQYLYSPSKPVLHNSCSFGNLLFSQCAILSCDVVKWNDAKVEYVGMDDVIWTLGQV